MLETKVTRILTNSPPGATSLETESQYVSLKIAAGGTFNELITCNLFNLTMLRLHSHRLTTFNFCF